jgi:hypothetical protein
MFIHVTACSEEANETDALAKVENDSIMIDTNGIADDENKLNSMNITIGNTLLTAILVEYS